jgi:hypothetical protein
MPGKMARSDSRPSVRVTEVLVPYLRSARRIRHQLPRPSVPVRITGRNIVAFERRVGDVGGEETRF